MDENVQLQEMSSFEDDLFLDNTVLTRTTLQGQPKEYYRSQQQTKLKCWKAVGISAVGISPADLTFKWNW